MHQMALLKAEVETLREANSTLSKRRRAKRTRLQQGGSMTLGEGQELQDQKDIEQQVQCDMQQSSGRKRRIETKRKCCSVCGNAGHNARTCVLNEEISDKEDGN